jgi:hypothetical protein
VGGAGVNVGAASGVGAERLIKPGSEHAMLAARRTKAIVRRGFKARLEVLENDSDIFLS